MAFLMQSCSSVLFMPSRELGITPDKVNLSYNPTSLPTSDGLQLQGWYLPAAVPALGTVLFLHGNGENISSHLATVYWLPAAGYNVYLFDYRGYGQSQGEPDLDGSMRDIEAMLDYVIAQQPAQKIIVLGHSLGASMGIYAISQSPHKADLAAMISIAAFSDYQAVTRDVLSRSWLSWLFQWPLSLAMDNRYSPKKYVAQLAPLPVLIMHSAADEIIESYHGDVLFNAASEPKYFQALQGDHNHMFNDKANRQLLLQWLARLSDADRPAPTRF